MKLGFVSDSLAHLGFEEVLETAAELGLDGVEVNTGNWSSAPHFDVNRMKSSADARKAFTEAFASRGLKLIALNANGNQLHPVTGDTQSACLHDTIRLAGEIGTKKVCLMAGLPGGAVGESPPNCRVSSLPPWAQSTTP